MTAHIVLPNPGPGVRLVRLSRPLCPRNLHREESDIRSDATLGGRLIIERAGNLELSYAPFEHIERGARIAIVGITPGAALAAAALLILRRIRPPDRYDAASRTRAGT